MKINSKVFYINCNSYNNKISIQKINQNKRKKIMKTQNNSYKKRKKKYRYKKQKFNNLLKYKINIKKNYEKKYV